MNITPTMMSIDGSTVLADFDRSERLAPVPNVAGESVDDWLERKRLGKAVENLKKDGFKPSSEVANATAVTDAIKSYRVEVPAPLVRGLTPAEATEALDHFVERKGRQAAAKEARAVVLAYAITDLRDAVVGDVDRVIDFYRDDFSNAAAAYAEAHDFVVRFPDVASAAMADQSGEAVVLWHKGRTAAAEIERIVSLILPMLYENPASEFHFNRAICLIADPEPITNITAISSAIPDLQKGTVSPGIHFGRVPLLAAAGADIALPVDRLDWADRLEEYESKRDAYMMSLFRDDE
ncbi:hypothetical protein HX744_14485 [Pseudonocardia sp. ICBG1122]|nr:hypothetical protein [Pseudonocardia pini]